MSRAALVTGASAGIGASFARLLAFQDHPLLCPGFTRSKFHGVVREAWAAVNAGKPVCVPGAVDKMLAGAMRPIPRALQYRLGRDHNPFAH